FVKGSVNVHSSTGFVNITAAIGTVNVSGDVNIDDQLIVDRNMGIGTTNPFSLLHLYENNVEIDSGLIIEQDDTGDAVLQLLLTGTQCWVVGIDNSDSDKFKIAHSHDLNSDVDLTIDITGQVGIGTTSPASQLNVLETTAATNTVQNTVIVEATSSGTPASGFGTSVLFQAEDDSNGATTPIGAIGGVWISAAAGTKHGGLIFGTRDGAINDWTDAGFEKMRIENLGDVGFGTIDPTEDLHVNQSSRAA
ncbi:unnamed protein product, partial [marine sediment metagenome]